VASPPPLPLPPGGPVRVVEALGELRLVATAPIPAGERILRIDGELAGRPSRYSIQVGEELHVEVPATAAPDAVPGLYPWRFLNHSCAPNAVVRERALLALRPIDAGEEITFDYNATEWELTAPFTCRCGACGGARIAGLRHLPPDARARVLPNLAPHLRRRLDAPGA